MEKHLIKKAPNSPDCQGEIWLRVHRYAAVSLRCIPDKTNKQKKRKQGQQDKLQIRYATRLAQLKMQQILSSLLLAFFFLLLLFNAIACGNLSCHAGRVFGENSFVKPCAAEWLQGRGGGARGAGWWDKSHNLAGNLERIVLARRRRPAGRFLRHLCGSDGVKALNSSSVQQSIDWCWAMKPLMDLKVASAAEEDVNGVCMRMKLDHPIVHVDVRRVCRLVSSHAASNYSWPSCRFIDTFTHRVKRRSLALWPPSPTFLPSGAPFPGRVLNAAGAQINQLCFLAQVPKLSSPRPC